ncbi:glutamic acid-rich protein-like [Bactrocera tryoni]|uniref:glutamic acid-rich protein-like n=1 Tax=Bactrocera tryoni TaxID=59916 RepID=UPI001A9757B5|nr:glutamic acid-rich protein-like [Bactrocera tryoni]XP_039956305.1 glutamic acid-rich protein-like [Bactrocera tryoni]XP_039956306.1 glutamic acid-rich protein-like [Bactrocera tryoni]XP_039956309.1 glutamic acid-rich protein-like [Bactrocera tryoni]
MFCKVALTCLLGITAINARTIGNYYFPTYPTQNTNEFYPGAAIPDYNPKRYGDTTKVVRVSLSMAPPSRHLLPPYEDYGDAQAYSNGIYRSELPAWQYRNEMPAQYEEVERLAPQSYPYEVVNRILPKVEEPTDFQPLETQLSAQEKQITQVADDVKSVQQIVSELEKYLEGVAAALVPQNKAKNGVIKISMNLVPKLGEVQTGSMSEKEIDKLISSTWGEDSTEANTSEEGKELDKLISSTIVEDSAAHDSAKKERELDDLISSMFGVDSNESSNSKNDKELDKLISSLILEDSAVNDSDKGLVNVISSMIVAKSADDDSEEKEKYLEKFITSLFEDDYAKNLIEKTDENSDAEEEYGKKLDAFLNQIFAEEAQEEEEKMEEEKEQKIEEEKEEEIATAETKEVEQLPYDLSKDIDYLFGEGKDVQNLDLDDQIVLEDYLMNKKYILNYKHKKNRY